MTSTDEVYTGLKIRLRKSYINLPKANVHQQKSSPQLSIQNKVPLGFRLRRSEKNPGNINTKIPGKGGTNYALLNGINYIGTRNQLNGCINDMNIKIFISLMY